MKPFLGCLCFFLLCSCGESESETLARETREREADQKEAWEQERKRIQEASEQMKQGDGFALDDR